MVKADTSVKWFHSDQPDAPVLRGQAGAMIELLDACLLNGFSPRTPDSVVVAGGVATVSISAGNPYEKHAVIEISGASVSALNDEWRIDTAAASSFTFLCPGVADGAATGATIKRAAAGWSKPFAGTNTATYQSIDPLSTQLFLNMVDTDPRAVAVRGYESMPDATTKEGPFPTESQASGGVYWLKSYQASDLPRRWALFADGCVFYVYLATASIETNYPALVGFGDFVPFDHNDRYHCFIAGAPAVNTSYPGARVCLTSIADPSGLFVARAIDQMTKSTSFAKWSVYGGGSAVQWGSYAFPVGGVILLRSPILVSNGVNLGAEVRGILAGMVEPFGLVYTNVNTLPFEGSGVLSGRMLAGYAIRDTSLGYGNFAVDLTGPWR